MLMSRYGFIRQTAYAGTEQKLMKTHRANLVHDCVDVIEFYDRNVFDKHWLIQNLSQFYVLVSVI